MEDDEEKFSLRDKFAIEIFAVLLSKSHICDSITSASEEEFKKLTYSMSTKLIRSSYKLADIMRKARLGAFE